MCTVSIFTGDEGSEKLNFVIDMSGEQMLEVRAEGFSGDYPWSGSHQSNLSFPLEEGSTAEGEGWAFVLHLNKWKWYSDRALRIGVGFENENFKGADQELTERFNIQD